MMNAPFYRPVYAMNITPGDSRGAHWTINLEIVFRYARSVFAMGVYAFHSFLFFFFYSIPFPSSFP